VTSHKQEKKEAMTEPNIGEKILSADVVSDGKMPERDAIHVAVIPLMAGESYMRSGENVRLSLESHKVAMNGDYGNHIGVIDPFMEGSSLNEGDWFWCFLKPGTVTGMRHHWQHPSFEGFELPSNDHELWLRQFCDRWNFEFQDLIEEGTSSGYGYITARGRDLHGASDLGEDEGLFWMHLEGYVGKEFDDDHKQRLEWSCSC
jgi:hypothetical protein